MKGGAGRRRGVSFPPPTFQNEWRVTHMKTIATMRAQVKEAADGTIRSALQAPDGRK